MCEHDTIPSEPDTPRPTARVIRDLVLVAQDAAIMCASGDADATIRLLGRCEEHLLEALRDFGAAPDSRLNLTEAGHEALRSSSVPPAAQVDRGQLLSLALDAIKRNEAAYGAPWPFLHQVAALWSTLLERQVKPTDVAMCMVLFKVGRLAVDPAHLDSWTDLAGYAALGAEVSSAAI